MPPATMLISPAGDIDGELLDIVCNGVRHAFGLPAKVLPLFSDISFALDPARGQYQSTKLLGRLSELAPAGAVRVLGVTDVDLFIPILTYVFGEAQLGGRSAIISIHRLAEAPMAVDFKEHFRKRVVKEAIHELGHTFNLRHCPDKCCIMHYCRSLEDVDEKADQLCRYCHVLLKDALHREGLGSI